jgi:hypothetical protein
MFDSNELRGTPSRIETAFQSRRGPLKFWVLQDCCKTEIREARIPRIIDKHVSLKLINERNIHRDRHTYGVKVSMDNVLRMN